MRVRVRLLFSDGGEFRVQKVSIPAASLELYDRLIDCLREDPEVQKELYVDYERLCAAQVMGEVEEDDEG